MQLKELIVLIQPGYSICNTPVPEDEMDLITATEKFLLDVAEKQHAQVVVLMNVAQDSIDSIRTNQEHPIHVVIAMIDRTQHALQEKCLQISNAFGADRDACKNYIARIRQHLVSRGYELGSTTTVSGMGETIGGAVPSATQNLGLLIHSDQKSKVLLDFTNARKAKNRAKWRLHGEEFRKAKERYQYLEFVPLGRHA